MPYLKKLSVFALTSSVIVLAGCTTVAEPVKSQEHQHAKQASSEQDSQKMGMHKNMAAHDMTKMREEMHKDHMIMSKMDMSKMDMSKMSTECQDMMKKMKAKMASRSEDAQMMGKGMDGMGEHDMTKMMAMKAKHDKCMTEMKAASPTKHRGHH